MGCVGHDSTCLCVSKCERVGELHRKQRYLSATKKYQATERLETRAVTAVHAPPPVSALPVHFFTLSVEKLGALPLLRSLWLAADCSVEMSILAIGPSRDGKFLNLQAYISLSAHPRH